MLNSTSLTSFSLSFNGSGTLRTLYNNSDTTFALTLPAPSNGSVVAKIDNTGNRFVQIKGALSVYISTEQTVTTYTLVHQYRLLGFGLTGFSVLAVFFLVWNPGKVISQGLDAISSKVRNIGSR